MFDFVVIGAGFAGSVIAERAANVLGKKVLVVEKREHIGGNCYDEKISDVLVHRYGPHLFHTNSKAVFDYLSRFTEWELYHHKVLAFVDGQKVPIPFNLNTMYALFPFSLAKTIEKKLLSKYGYGEKVPILTLRKESDKDLKFLSDFVYEKIFKHYTAKQWGVSPEEIAPEVTARVPVSISKDDRYFTDRYQAVPKEGYSKVFEKMLDHPNIEVMLGTDCDTLLRFDFGEGKVYLNDKVFNGKIVYTGMIDALFDFKFGHLPYRSLDLVFETMNKSSFQETATVNYPNDYDFTRITEFKHIHPASTDTTVILKEYPKTYIAKRDIPFYPVFTQQNHELYEKYKKEAQRFANVIFVGRLAEYRYYDMDDVVKRALDVFEEKLYE